VGFRTVVITSHCKCSFKNGYMIIRAEDQKMIHLSEIDTVIFENTAVSVSCVLLNELSQHKIGIVFCNERHLPQGTFVSFGNNYASAGRIMSQVAWDSDIKKRTWELITKQKISKQSQVLAYYGFADESLLLESYMEEVYPGDPRNREGFAAKVYFNALFGDGFSRRCKYSSIECNACLDYGYSILLAMIAREIVAAGYELAIGIHHKGTSNPYNLACDIMEPFRPLVDVIVLQNFTGTFDSNIKQCFWKLGSVEAQYKDSKYYLPAVISSYLYDVCKCMDGVSNILPEYEMIWKQGL
jgi:CRISP-associated protein Cas1